MVTRQEGMRGSDIVGRSEQRRLCPFRGESVISAAIGRLDERTRQSDRELKSPCERQGKKRSRVILTSSSF